MKKILIAVLMTALLLTPIFAACGEETQDFALDQNRVLQGMERSLAQGYEPTVSGDRWTMVLPVTSEKAFGTVTAELLAPDGEKSPFRTQTMTVTAVEEPRGVWAVKFVLRLFSDKKNADVPCKVRLTGKDREGNALTAEFPVKVKIRGCDANADRIRMEIADVQADLNVGENGEIRVTLTNPCEAADFENVELKISDGTGNILPRNAEALNAGDLKAGESMTVTYPVTVLGKATVAPHTLKLDLNWTALGKAASQSDNYTVAVKQEIRLEQGGVKLANSVCAGDSVTLSLPLMNMGRADVVNVLATVSMPGVTERQSVLVGTIQPGETKQAQLILSPNRDAETGDFSGTVSVECTDQDGNEASFELPIQLTVKEPAKTTAVTSTGESVKKESTPPVVWGLSGGCGVLVMLLLLQGILLRRKVHHLEEERL